MPNDPHSYAQALKILDQSDLFSSPDGFMQALLKKAAAAPSYLERSQLYAQLSVSSDCPPAFREKVLYLKGLNDFEEGLKCQKQPNQNKSTTSFEKAARALEEAIQLGRGMSLFDTASAQKYLSVAYAHLPGESNIRKAWEILDRLIENDALLSTFKHPEDIYCLSAWVALHQTDKRSSEKLDLYCCEEKKRLRPTLLGKNTA